MNRFSLALSGAMTVATPVVAQATLVVPPALARQEGISRGTMAGFGARARQQILVADRLLVAMRGKVIDAVWFRREPLVGRTVGAWTSSLRIEVSRAARSASAPSIRFDDNHGPDRTVLFSGLVVVPASSTCPTPAPWRSPHALRIDLGGTFVYSGGDLCLDVSGTPQAPTSNFSWWLDYEQESAGGVVQSFGAPCGLPTTENVVTAGAFGANASPGCSLPVAVHGWPGTPGVLLLGPRLTTPLALDPYGASGCTLYLLPLVGLVGVFPPSAGDTFSALHIPLQVPATAAMAGGRICVQGTNLEGDFGPSNPLRLTTTNALDITIGALPPASLSIVRSDAVLPGLALPDQGAVTVSRGPVMQFEYR